MKMLCNKCGKKFSMSLSKWETTGCPDCHSFDCSDYEKVKQQIPDPELEKRFLDEAHKLYDDNLFCPKCGAILSGLHMKSNCYMSFIRKTASQLYKNFLKEEKSKK